MPMKVRQCRTARQSIESLILLGRRGDNGGDKRGNVTKYVTLLLATSGAFTWAS
jgi:hypothetical protein